MPNLAVRRKGQVRATSVVCDCGRTITGRGITRWKYCPYCAAPIIKNRDQRRREWKCWGETRILHTHDEEIASKYKDAITVAVPTPEPVKQ